MKTATSKVITLADKRNLVNGSAWNQGKLYQFRLMKLASQFARHQKYQPAVTVSVTRSIRTERTEREVSVITRDTPAEQCAQFTASNKPTGNLPERLLSDIHGIFMRSKADKLRVMEIISNLCADTSKPWATFCEGRSLSARRLNSMLACYHVSSKDLRFKDGVFKGLSKESIVEACSRKSQ